MVNARQPAKISRIIDLLNGEYVVKEGWIPNFVVTKLGEISRANIMGVVVSVDNPQNFWLDDATGRILVRSFVPDAVFDFQLGDVVLVIGRPRKYNEQMLLVSEIVKRIENKKWIDYRQEEIKILNSAIKESNRQDVIEHETGLKEETFEEKKIGTKELENNKQDEQQDLVDYNALIIKKIKELDSGVGIEIDKLIENLDFNAEKRINLLLEEGFIFNIKPGRVKVLE